LKELYSANSPVTSSELAELLDEKAVTVHGQPGLGGFAVKLVDQLKNKFPALDKQLAQLDSSPGKWYSLVICDFVRNKENGNVII